MAESNDITVTIKSSVDKKYEFTIPLTITVTELKDKIAAEADVPADRQRLIYSGRVLKDQDTLEVYKIKSGHTIHLVKSAGARQSTPASSASAAGSGSNTPGATNSSNPASQSVPSNIASGQGSFNPLAGLTGARYAGLAQLPSASMFGPDGGMGALPNEDEMERMMSNPTFQQSMNEMLRNPQMMDYLIEQSPQLRGMGPQVRQMMQSDQFRQMLTNPQMFRQMREMQRMFGGGAAPGQAQSAFPAPGANPTTESDETNRDTSTTAGSNTTQGTNTPGTDAASNPFAALFPGGAPANPFAMFGNPSAGAGGAPALDPALLQSILGGGAGGAGGAPGLDPALLQSILGGGAGAAQQDTRPPEERYESQLRQLNDMGFSDFDRNVRALRRSGGSVQGAVEALLSDL